MTLVDTNILLDVVNDDPVWAPWALAQLDAAALKGPLAINAVVYAELSVRFERIEDVDGVVAQAGLAMETMPRAALFLAGKAFLRYRAAGGARTGGLPDFFIGAHAAVEAIPLLTRDARRYRTYFPSLLVIAPSA